MEEEEDESIAAGQEFLDPSSKKEIGGQGCGGSSVMI
jgi:hypothetical protein